MACVSEHNPQSAPSHTDLPFQPPWQGPCSPQTPSWTWGHRPPLPEGYSTQRETLRFGFGQTSQGLMYHGVPVGTKPSLWAPHSPACCSSTWLPPQLTHSECAEVPEEKRNKDRRLRSNQWIFLFFYICPVHGWVVIRWFINSFENMLELSLHIMLKTYSHN